MLAHVLIAHNINHLPPYAVTNIKSCNFKELSLNKNNILYNMTKKLTKESVLNGRGEIHLLV